MGVLSPTPRFASPVPTNGTDALRFAYRRAGGRETFFSRIGAILFGGSRTSPARTRAYFSLVGKVGKSTHRGGTLSMGSLPYVPHPHDDTKGGEPPLESPRIDEICPEFLWILPQVHPKNYVSTRTKRNMSPFNRAAAEASLTTRPQIRKRTKFSGRAVPNLIETD